MALIASFPARTTKGLDGFVITSKYASPTRVTIRWFSLYSLSYKSLLPEFSQTRVPSGNTTTDIAPLLDSIVTGLKLLHCDFLLSARKRYPNAPVKNAKTKMAATLLNSM